MKYIVVITKFGFLKKFFVTDIWDMGVSSRMSQQIELKEGDEIASAVVVDEN